MILVLGATGMIGGEVARQLVERGLKPRLLVRDPPKAGGFGTAVEIVQGDLGRPDTLVHAFAGIEKLFLMSGTHGGVNVQHEMNAIEAVRRASVEQVVKLSVVGAGASEDSFARPHAQCEARLRDSGIAWTMVRPHFFMSNMLRWADMVRSQGVVYYPTGEGRWAAVDPADIAAVAVAALTEAGHAGKAYAVSGPESLNAAQYVERLSATIGRPLRFVDVPLESVRANMLRSGIPEAHVAPVIDLLAAMKAGRSDFVDEGVREATGRAPTSFDDWARRNAAVFR